jgi:hypothetical protein
MKTLKQILSATLLLVVMAGCKKDAGTDDPYMRSAATSEISVAMFDTSSVVSIYDAINIEIVSVEVKYANSSRSNEWQRLITRPGIYNLKELNGEIHTEIAKKRDLAKGKITDLRITLGTHNSVIVGASVFDLQMSTASGNVIMLGLDGATINDHTATEILLQVDVARTVIKMGGIYVFEPVIEVHRITQRAQ